MTLNFLCFILLHSNHQHMAACCGDYHTITLSNDGTLHFLEKIAQGQLGRSQQ